MKLLTAVLAGLIVGLFGLQYALCFGDKYLFDIYRLTQTTELTRRDNLALQQGNDQPHADVSDLPEGGETVDPLPRSQCALIKENETFFQIIE